MIRHLALLAACALVGFAPLGIADTPNPLEQSSRPPVSKSVAFKRCIDLTEPPSWKHTPHHSCTVEWSVLGSSGKAVLYRARYQWPSDEGAAAPYGVRSQYFVVTEVLFRGADKGTVVTPLFALQEDETYNFLHPLALHKAGGRKLIEIVICLNGTGGCGQDFLSLRSGKLHALKNKIREQIDRWLPVGFSTENAPQIDIDSLTGTAGGWRSTDPHASPFRIVAFSLTLLPEEIKVKDLHFVSE